MLSAERILLAACGMCLVFSGVLAAGRCPQDWQEYNNYCYYFGSSRVNWYQARDICKTRGAVLTSITSNNEVQKLRVWARQLGPTDWFYIGITDAGTEGKWRNIDRKPFKVPKSAWQKGQPDNSRGKEHCGNMPNFFGFNLNDGLCTSQGRYICKRAVGFVDPCDSDNGWHLVNGRCYKLHADKETWANAKQVCAETDAQLLSVTSSAELNFISESVSCSNKDPIWIGVSDTLDRKSLQWEDTKTPAANLLKWDKKNGQPSQSAFEKGNNCGAVIPANRYMWTITSCKADRKRFVCEKQKGLCPPGWTQRGDNCFKLNFARKTFTSAQTDCERFGGSIADLSKAKLPAKIPRTYKVWAPVSDFATDNTYAYADGTLVAKSAWAPGQPKAGAAKGRYDCAFTSRTSKLSLNSCFVVLFYVCQAPLATMIVAPTTPVPERLKCYPGWLYYNKKCYSVNLKEKSYSAAKADCKNNNADLVVINDRFELSFLAENIKDHNWIGLDSLSGKWMWADNTPLTITNWNKGEPNNAGGKEKCAEMTGDRFSTGGWNDLPCNVNRDYVCETDAVAGDRITPTTRARPFSPLCGQGWIYDERSSLCYLFSPDALSWREAQTSCQKKGANLVSVESKEEEAFLKGVFMADPTTAPNYWIGASDLDVESGWSWVDGKPYRFLNWNNGEPNNLNNEDCAEWYKGNNRWNDLPCNRKINYICKKVAVTSTTPSAGTTPLPIVSDNCETIADLVSGDHWVPDSAITASSTADKNSGTENARLDWTTADQVVTISTKDQYRYIPVINMHLRGVTSVTFTLQACNDGHVSLQPAADGNITRDAYEIVIGGWNNGQSAIRKQHQSSLVVKDNQGKYLDCNSPRPFWISWANGIISVGRGSKVDGSQQFLSYKDPKPYPIGGMAVSTGWGATGVWKVNNPHGTRYGAWRPKYRPRTGLAPSTEQTITGAWIQVDFLKPTIIQSITTLGRSDAVEYVSMYYIQFAYDDVKQLETLLMPGTTNKIKYFPGNKDKNTEVTNRFDSPFEARFVRIVLRKFVHYPAMRFALSGCPSPKYCKPERLVAGPSSVSRFSLTASSIASGTVQDARMIAGSKGWVATTPDPAQTRTIPNEFIQVRLPQTMIIYGIMTQGNKDQSYWVKSFNLQFRQRTSFSWITYQEPYGQTKLFTANTDKNTIVTNVLKNPVQAYYVRIYPREYQGLISMRFDILGCLSGCSTSSLISGERPIDAKRITASSQLSNFASPARGRLNTKRDGSALGAWQSRVNAVGQFIQINFGVTEKIRAVATQGRADADNWVKNYRLAYSRDGKKFYYYYSSRYILTGNTDRSTVVKNFLPFTLSAMAIRFYPTKWNKAIAMRVEVYGCQGNIPTYSGCYLDGSAASSFDGDRSYLSFNNPKRCSANCFSRGYMYAAMRLSLCYCSSRLPRGAKSARACTYRCRGDRNRYCGGANSAYSVYETGLGPNDERCPEGYNTYRDKCYKLNKQLGSWQQGQQACRMTPGGDLATINSDADQAYLTTVTRSSSKHVWIGLNDLQDQMSFDWADGSQVLKTYWMHGEPNNYRGKKEDCVFAATYGVLITWLKEKQRARAQTGMWNDALCSTQAYSLCQAQKIKIDAPMTTAAPPKGCPQGWKAYESSCYLMIEHYSTWSLAQSNCARVGGTLARIEDEFEQKFIDAELYNRDGYTSTRSVFYWTDLRYSKAAKDYVWSNKWDVVPYTHWDKGQPNTQAFTKSSRVQYPACVLINGKTEKNVGYWQTKTCFTGGYSLCERARAGFKQPGKPTLSPDDVTCPDGWIGLGHHCYQINVRAAQADRLDWFSAEKYCTDQGAHLATVSNSSELEPLNKETFKNAGWFWIGLNDVAKNKGYEWTSGESVSYTNWAKGEPNDWDGLEPCVVMNGLSGLWNDEKCHVPQNWICSIKKADYKNIKVLKTTLPPSPGPSGKCGSDDSWKLFHGRCYWLNQNELSWQAAEAACMSNGGHLASIRYEYENSFVQYMSRPLLTNLNERNIKYGGKGTRAVVWIGLNELDRSKGHRWSDGSPLRFNRWSKNEPNDWLGGEFCTNFYVFTGLWNDELCNLAHASVCEKPRGDVAPLTTTPEPSKPGHCSKPGYVEFENSCYKAVMDGLVNRSDANIACKADRGFLTTIRNSREQTFLMSMIAQGLKKRVDFWIGMRQIDARAALGATEGTWDDNAEVTYTNWNHGQPNQPGSWSCVVITPQSRAGSWEDRNCQTTNGYICRIPKDPKVTTKPAEDNSKCPTGFKFWNRACYKYVDQNSNWAYHDGQLCDQGSKLLSIQSPFEEAFVRRWMWENNWSADVWVGLSSKPNTNSFRWSNFWPVTVTYWAKGEPSTAFRSAGGCVVMSSGKMEEDGEWKVVSCTEMHSAICKKSLDAPPIKLPTSGVCNSANGEQWYAHTDGNCWLFHMEMRYTWDDAEQACRTTGGNLASFHTEEDTNFIEQYTQFEAVGPDGQRNMWIGLRKATVISGWTWTDRSAVFYTNWADKMPSTDMRQRCVELSSSDRLWTNKGCMNKRGFICKIKQGRFPKTFPTPASIAPPTAVPTTPRNSPCQLDGWIYDKSTQHCYLVVSDANELRHWQEALEYCSAPGREADLLHIGSADENAWVVKTLLPKVTSNTDVWLGFAELVRDNRFRWTNGARVTFVNWAGIPQTNTGSMECTVMKTNGLVSGAAGKWTTEYCFDRKAFICSVNATKSITPTTNVPVTSGDLCQFPFLYRGQKFNTCTTYGTNYLWCATTNHYEKDGKFAICDPYECPKGWRKHAKKCYYFSASNDRKSWPDAEQQCDTMSSDLAFISSATVESFITNNIYDYFWIGLNDRLREGLYIWDHRPRIVMLKMFSNWGLNEPRSTAGSEDCVMIVNGPYSDGRPGEWVTGDCSLERRYVCMKDAQYTLNKTTNTPLVITQTPKTVTNYGSSPQPTPKMNKPSSPESYVATPATADSGMRPGEVVAIVIACVALVLAGVFIYLYIQKVRPQNDSKDLGFSASYKRNTDSVGLENPNFSADG